MIGGGREATAPVRVVARGPFAVGSTIWRDAWGRLTCTVVAKATYDLTPGDSVRLDVPQPLQRGDAHWDDAPSRSVRIPGDLDPFKRAAEVVVVGSAFAAAPAASLVARVVVGNVDKSIELFPPRAFRLDGTVEPGTPLARFSLRYERAAGGPETDNPAGIDVGRADGRGRYSVPEILPPFHPVGGPGAHVPSCGLGPLAASWPSRASLLGPEDRAWLVDPTAAPLPPGFPAGYFQAAPPDQWLDRSLAANERIVLEALHPEMKRLVMSLAGREPRGIVAGGAPQSIRLSADLLFVDTDRGLCTLTYRGQLQLEEGGPPVRVVVVDAPLAGELSPAEVRRIAAPADDIETTFVEGLGVETLSLGASGGERQAKARPVLPFARGALGRPPQPSSPDGVLPFRIPDAPPSTPAVEPAPAAVAVPPLPVRVPPPPSSVPPPFTVAPPVSLTAPRPPSITSAAGPMLTARGPLTDTPAPTAAPPSPPRASAPSPSFDAAFGGVRATSDAAAASARVAPAEAPRQRAAPPASAPVADGRRQAVVSLLCLDPAIVPRVRATKRLAAALTPRPRPRRAQQVDEPHEKDPPDDRRDVLRVLSCGQPSDAAEIRGALAESLEDQDDFELPLVLVAGELRPTFDEVEMLRAIVAIVQQAAGDNRKVLASLAVGQAALASPIPLRPEATLGLVKQIEVAAASLSLPAGYVPAEVERLLVEGRKYKRRTLLGAPRLRAELTLLRSGEKMPLYLPEAAAISLPLLPAFPVVALCEITPREDLTEAPDEALVAVALGRVLRSQYKDAR